MGLDVHEEDEPRDEEEVIEETDEPSDPMHTLSIKYNLMNGDIDFDMPEGLNRMQVRAVLSNALCLLDADIVSEAFENKMRAVAAMRAHVQAQKSLLHRL